MCQLCGIVDRIVKILCLDTSTNCQRFGFSPDNPNNLSYPSPDYSHFCPILGHFALEFFCWFPPLWIPPPSIWNSCRVSPVDTPISKYTFQHFFFLFNCWRFTNFSTPHKKGTLFPRVFRTLLEDQFHRIWTLPRFLHLGNLIFALQAVWQNML